MFRRFPCILQRDSMDCGPACIATVALKYKKQIPLAKIREIVGADTNGSNIYRKCKVSKQRIKVKRKGPTLAKYRSQSLRIND